MQFRRLTLFVQDISAEDWKGSKASRLVNLKSADACKKAEKYYENPKPINSQTQQKENAIQNAKSAIFARNCL